MLFSAIACSAGQHYQTSYLCVHGHKTIFVCMYFHYPGVLWALGALSLPILIHLLHLRPVKHVYFSNLPMLQDIVHQVQARRRVAHWFVLLCRLLAGACVIFAFAGPYLPTRHVAPRSHYVLLYVDNSYSMSNLTAADEAALHTAVYVAQQIVHNYDKKTRFFLLTNDLSPLRPLLQREILAQLAKITYSSRRRTASACQERIQRLQQHYRVPLDAYWISDFQANLFDTKLHIDTVNRWHILPIFPLSTHNIFIDTAYSAVPTWRLHHPNRICVRVQNMRNTPCDPCTVKLFVEGTQQALQTVSLGAGHASAVCFDYTPDTLVDQRMYVQVDDPVVLFDNRFYLSPTAAAPVSILEVADLSAPTYVEQAYAENERFIYQRYTLDELPYAQLYAQDLVILQGLSTLPRLLQRALSTFLSAGKSLLVIPPVQASSEGYVGLFPGFTFDSTAQRLQPLTTPRHDAPFYAQVFTRSKGTGQISMPQATASYQWRPLDLEPLLRFVAGKSFLSTSRYLSGRRYLLSAPLSAEYTNFMQHALFVPTLYKVATQSQQQHEQLYTRLDMQALFTAMVHADKRELFYLRGESGKLHALSTSRHGEQHRFFVEKAVQQPGFYALLQDSTQLRWMACNLPAAESILRCLNTQALAKKLAPLQHLVITQPEIAKNPRATGEFTHLPILLWQYFVAAALFFFILEAVYLRYGRVGH